MTNSDVDVNLNQILTPASRCVCLKLGRINSSVLEALADHDFEVAPVVDESNFAVGLIPTEKARELASQNALLSPRELQREDITMPEIVGLRSLMTKLRDRAAILVAPKGGSDGEPIAWTGLVTIYDLNRHYFRTLVYGLLAELEVGLAGVIESWGRDPWDWIAVLNEEEQARVIGYWKLAERRHADIGPTAACMLTQLLKVVARDRSTLTALGFGSKTEFETLWGGIPEVRNQIMHPVRPMILTVQDTAKLADRIDSVRNLNLRLAELKEHKATAANT